MKDTIEKELDDILETYSGKTYKDLTYKQACYLKNSFLRHIEKIYPNIYNDKDKDMIFKHPLQYSNGSISTITKQVWKRKIYFRIYHKGVKRMNEIKEAALYCFWILKLQPFFIYGQSDFTNKLNIKLAIMMLLNGVGAFTNNKNIQENNKKKNDNEYKVLEYSNNFSGTLVDDLYYSFTYRDWSKEALMDLGERLVVYSYFRSKEEHRSYNELMEEIASMCIE